MYLDDLGPYETSANPEVPVIRTIGWLDRDVVFTRGVIDAVFVAKLRTLLDSEYPYLYTFGTQRGLHYCHFCPPAEAREHASGCELLVPDVSAAGQFFSAPYLVGHYVSVHGYLPPKVFVDSVLAVDFAHVFDAVVVYDELVMSEEQMRNRYEREAKINANLGPEDHLTERQRAYRRLGVHLRYAKWLQAHPQVQKTGINQGERP